MNYDGAALVLCEENMRPLLASLVQASGLGAGGFEFVSSGVQLWETLKAGRTRLGLILVDAALTWDGKLLQEFYGFDVAARLRRDIAVKAPIIFFSPLPRAFFENAGRNGSKYSLLNSTGSGFASLPCTPDELAAAVSAASPLGDAELAEVVINDCGLLDEWRATAHKIGNALVHYETSRPDIIEMTGRWAETIELFAPAHTAALDEFRRLLKEPPPRRTRPTLNALSKNSTPRSAASRPSRGATPSALSLTPRCVRRHSLRRSS